MNILIGALLLSLASAQDNPPSHVKAELIAEQASIQPGGKVTVALHLTMQDGWHTYWRNPGDTGMATIVKWKLPPGFKAGELQWPYPTRFVGKRTVSYGYEKETSLFSDIEAPASIKEGSVTIAAKAEWLECKDICVPGEAELSVELPVRSARLPGNQILSDVFSRALSKLPKKMTQAPFSKWRFSAGAMPGYITLTFESKPDPLGVHPGGQYGYPVFFPDDNYLVANDRLAGFHGYMGPEWPASLEMRMQMSKTPSTGQVPILAGVLVVAPDQAVEISVPFRDSKTRRKPL